MRVARLKESGKRACYHVMSRVVDRQMVRGAEAGALCTMRDLRQEVVSPPKAA